MKVFNNLIKLAINIFSIVFRSNLTLRKYLFEVALKNEIQDYVDTGYFQGYAHINKAIRLLLSISLNDFMIIDVGGADGTTGKLFAYGFPNTKIWIFEPIRENLIQLQNSVSNFKNIVVVPKAAGNFTGKAVIHKASRITSSSLMTLNPDLKSPVFSDALVPDGTEEIDIVRLDDVFDNQSVGIMKLDVQGFELEVLKGSVKTLQNTTLIIIEVNNHEGYLGSPKYFDIDQFLRNSEFILFDIFPSLKDNGQLKEWDCIYMKRDLIK